MRRILTIILFLVASSAWAHTYWGEQDFYSSNCNVLVVNGTANQNPVTVWQVGVLSNYWAGYFLPISGTNGLVTTGLLTSTSNTLAAATLSITNGLLIASDTNSLASKQLVTDTSNTLAGVTFAITNGLPTTEITNGLETISAANVLTNGLVDASVTNGLALPSVTNGLVGASVTNGLATPGITNGFVTGSITNGLLIPSDTNGYVTATVTNGLPNTTGTYASMNVGTATTAGNALHLGGVLASDYPTNNGAATFANVTVTNLTASHYVSTDAREVLTNWTLATPAWFNPGNPTGTTSNSYRAMGLGTTVHITPLFTGNVLFEFHFQMFQVNNTGTQAGQFILEYGSGTAPTNNQYGAVAGTTIGVTTTVQSSVAVGSQIHDYGQSIIVKGLMPGTAYWFDVAMERTSGTATASVQGVTCVLMEVP